MIKNCGGTYVLDANEADVFVKEDIVNKNGFVAYCEREYTVDELIENGSKIDKINIISFLKLINFNEKEVEDNYKIVKDKMVELIRKDETKKVKAK